MAEPARATAGEAVPETDMSVEAVLSRFNGDARAALAAAIEDIARLDRELQFASLAMSYGFARSGLMARGQSAQ